MPYADLALGATNVLLGSAVGAGVNQSLFVLPQWFSSPPDSLPERQESRPVQAFWIPLTVGSTLAIGAAWALNRHNPRRRRLLSAALGLYAATWATTAVYFAPEILRLARTGREMDPQEAATRGKRWLKLNWVRLAALGASWVLAAAAARQRPRGLRAGLA